MKILIARHPPLPRLQKLTSGLLSGTEVTLCVRRVCICVFPGESSTSSTAVITLTKPTSEQPILILCVYRTVYIYLSAHFFFRWRDVLPALEEMMAQGLVSDGRPFTVAIKALGDNGQTARALKLLEVRYGCMHRANVRLSVL